MTTTTEKEESDLANRIVNFLYRRLDGPEDNPISWAALAVNLGCWVETFNEPGGGRGEYTSTSDGQHGKIYYNTCGTRQMQIATLVHEIAHHVLVTWEIVPPKSTGSVCYQGIDNFAHNIAQRVEKIIAG